MPDLNQMQTLVLLAQLGSMAAVGRHQQISAAAVSKQVSKLEAELGVQLLMRTTRHLEFTEIGKNYCRQCRRVLEEVAEAEALVAQTKVEPYGSLKVVSARNYGAIYIVPFVKEFLSLYPKIELDLELAERVPDINSEGIDVVIGMSISATGDVIQKRIGTTRYVICATSKYCKKYGTPVKPADLAEHRYITHSMRKPDDEIVFRNGETITIVPYLRVNDAETMLSLALADMGIVMLHEYLVAEQLQNGSLIPLLSNFTKEVIPLYLAFAQRRHLAGKVRCFIDFFSAKAKKH